MREARGGRNAARPGARSRVGMWRTGRTARLRAPGTDPRRQLSQVRLVCRRRRLAGTPRRRAPRGRRGAGCRTEGAWRSGLGAPPTRALKPVRRRGRSTLDTPQEASLASMAPNRSGSLVASAATRPGGSRCLASRLSIRQPRRFPPTRFGAGIRSSAALHLCCLDPRRFERDSRPPDSEQESQQAMSRRRARISR